LPSLLFSRFSQVIATFPLQMNQFLYEDYVFDFVVYIEFEQFLAICLINLLFCCYNEDKTLRGDPITFNEYSQAIYEVL
jgi:hypothetical protein